MISKNIVENKNKIMDLFNNSSDLIVYEFETLPNTKALIIYINGLVDKKALDEYVVKPLVENMTTPIDIRSSMYITEIKEISNIKDAVNSITDGHVVLFHEDMEIAFVLNLCRYDKRAVEIPSSEQVIRGPKQAFIEDIYVNKSLIRRIIRNPNLVFEDFVYGEQTNTKVSIVYINGIVNQDILAELRARMKEIETDAILDVHYLEEYLEDGKRSPFSTIFNTERPDVVAGKILEGRIGILSDGSPHALTAPKIFIENLMSPEDYYVKPIFATFLRIIRLLSFLISILVAGVYISMITFQQEMLPTNLLVSIAGQREGVPLPTVLEALLMVFFFEILKEAGVRLPKAIGQTVTLIGGLVIGQAAVDAGLVSSIMVIVVSAAGITEFVNPSLRELITIYRLVMILLGGFFGFFGIISGLIILMLQIISTKSFGVPFFYPIAPYDKEAMKDYLRRSPIKKMNYRPKYISDKNSRKRNS